MSDPSLENFPSDYRADVAALPTALRTLLDRELAAGNRIIDVGHSHPAPPIGVYFKLERQVTTQPRTSTEDIRFIERHSSLYSGEFGDPTRCYFILEAPGPPPEMPDMDAIRAAANASSAPWMNGAVAASHDASSASAWHRFQRSLQIDYEKWKEGIGYDLEALAELTASERDQIANSMIPPAGWREVELLIDIDTDRTREALQHAAQHGPLEVRLAVADRAPELVSDALRTQTLTRALESADIMSGLSQALDQIEEFHPPAIVDALWRGLMEREGGVAYHCAATLACIHGKIDSRMNWSMRPLFLRFNTDDRRERHEAKRELQRVLGVPIDPETTRS